MQEFKFFIYSIISGLFSLLLPIKDFMTAMIVVFILNFLFGLFADFANGKEWDFKKARMFFIHCLVFFLLLMSIFVIGHFMHSGDETLGVITTLCWIAIFFYSTNIARNWQQMLVEGTTMWKVAGFVYYVLTLKMVEKIPYLSEYIKKGNGNELKQ